MNSPNGHLFIFLLKSPTFVYHLSDLGNLDNSFYEICLLSFPAL